MTIGKRMDPAGITQDPDLMKRFDPIEGGRKLRNYLKVMTLELAIARACGKNHLQFGTGRSGGVNNGSGSMAQVLLLEHCILKTGTSY